MNAQTSQDDSSVLASPVYGNPYKESKTQLFDDATWNYCFPNGYPWRPAPYEAEPDHVVGG